MGMLASMMCHVLILFSHKRWIFSTQIRARGNLAEKALEKDSTIV
jgi:hypothetical protein